MATARVQQPQAPGPEERRRSNFIADSIAELKKVVRPTRSELITYTSVVLVFVAVIMAFVTVLDLGIGKLTFWVFGG